MEIYTWPANDYRNYLCHYGILGMKWGIRRFQNPDGTYTLEGKIRRSSSGIPASIKFLDNDTDKERDAKVRSVVKKNLAGMRTNEIDPTEYKRYMFRYSDGTVHETENGETKEEARDIRDFKIAYKMAKKEYDARISGRSKENAEIIAKADEDVRKRAKKYGKNSAGKYLTIGIPHKSKAVSIIRYT